MTDKWTAALRQQLLNAGRGDREALARFDPIDLRLDFHSRYVSPSYLEDLTRAANARDGGVEYRQLTHGLPKRSIENVPTPVLSHELAHWLQVATTISGFRFFGAELAAAATYDRLLWLAARAEGKSGRGFPGYISGCLDLFDDVESFGEAYAAAVSSRADRSYEVGGTRVSLELLEHLPDLERSKSPVILATGLDPFLGRSDPVRTPFVDLSAFGAPGEAVHLGLWHLLEGYGALVEMLSEMRGATDATPERLTSMLLQEDRPFDPYHITRSFYVGMLPGRLTSKRSNMAAELAAVIDAALMADEWILGINDDRARGINLASATAEDLEGLPNYPLRERPFNMFLNMLYYLMLDPSLTLDALAGQAVREFQDELLRRAGVTIPSVEYATRMLIDNLEYLFETLEGERSGISISRHARDGFRKALDVRLARGPTVWPLQILAQSPRIELDAIVAGQLQVIIGSCSLTDGDGFDEGFKAEVNGHHRLVAEELIFGPQPCEAFGSCHLQARPACKGASTALSAIGRRCAREASIQSIIERFDADP